METTLGKQFGSFFKSEMYRTITLRYILTRSENCPHKELDAIVHGSINS